MTYAFERVGSGGTPFHLITTKMKPFNTEDWSSFVAGLDSGTCLMTMNLPAPRQWHSWPVILDNDAIGEQSNGPASGEFDLTFREVV